MSNFTFRLVDRLGLLDRIYMRLSNIINKYILSYNSLDMERIADIYDALDGFWLKHRHTDSYSSGQIRVIIGSVVESLRNNHLSASEIRIITNHIASQWDPSIAEKKEEVIQQSVVRSLLPERVEETALRAVEVYDQMKPSDVADFVAVSAPMVSHSLPAERIVKTLGRFFR